MKDYHINVFYSGEDDCYVADIPDLKFCSAFGDTPEAAVHEVEIAKQAWLEAAKASGKSIPKPKYRPVMYQLTEAEGWLSPPLGVTKEQIDEGLEIISKAIAIADEFCH